ncbi:MAG TPA: flavodoxin family protein [Burkholderiaceae bacterium]|nr:flavodoxin family protein [Burkholderiaceae bacterium]
MRKHIVIVYHSGYGHTKKVAEAVAEGSGGTLVAIDAEGNLPEGAWERVQAADAIVFGTPTYMGGPSWQFKKFADASSKAWFTQAWRNKLAAGFTNSASLYGDKGQTLQYLFTLSQQHGMLWTGSGMLPANGKAATRADVNHIGSSLGLMTATPSDASVDEMVAGDLATARAFGRRVAEAATLFAAPAKAAPAPANQPLESLGEPA